MIALLLTVQVRLNLLSTLRDEAFGDLHNSLCAGLLGRKLFTLPFHRDVQITEQQARTVLACLAYCQQVRHHGEGRAQAMSSNDVSRLMQLGVLFLL